MKKLLGITFLTLSSSLFTVSNAQTGTWTALTNLAPHNNQAIMLLLTDGTVICSNTSGGGYGTGWDKLTPDATGSYINGTWTSITNMTYDRVAFSSQVLPSGKVYVAGGEYGQGGTYGEVYDPVADAWTVCGNIPANWNIYDAPSELLYNGNVLDGDEIGINQFNNPQPCDNILQWNPTTLNYTTENPEPENHDEASWLKLKDSTVLTVGMPYPSNPAQDSSCRYVPQTNTWLVDNMTPHNIYDQWGYESGPSFLLPNGKAIFFGATQYNALYTPSGHSNTPGTWTSAANFPQIQGSYVTQPDAPGAMLVNGHILLAVAPIPTSNNNEFNSPTYFLEYNYVNNTFTQVTSPIPGYGDSLAGLISQNCSLLALPDGNVLMGVTSTSTSDQYFIYTPGSAAIPQGKPTINNVTTGDCTTFKITGKLFNGISEGNGYGDDAQNPTNYPLVRLTDGINVYYAKTTNWNRVGAVATDSLEDTAYFTLPTLPPNGTYSLVVVANGFASKPTLFTLPCVPTAVQPIAIENNTITVYPNPNNGIFTIVSSQQMDNSIVEVYNVMGQQMLKQEMTGSKKLLDLSSRSAGIYFYRVTTAEGKLLGNGKLVIQK